MVRMSSSVLRARCAESCAFPGTSPSRTATPCWRRLRRARAASRIFQRRAIAPARSIAWRKLGCEWKRLKDDEDGAIEVRGVGPRLKAPAESLDCGNSGSTMRMLSGILAGQPFTSELCGDESLSRRPMARIMTPLSEMGARIEAARRRTPSAQEFTADC